MFPKVLVAGGRGQLGVEVSRLLLEEGAEVSAPGHRELDITSPAALEQYLGDFLPSAIINCAAYTNVDGAEDDRETAMLVNARGPENLGRAAAALGIPVLHVSTDYVFDGNLPADEGGYDEDAEVNPLSVYGESKLEGERGLAESGARWTIVRVAWLYGMGGRNFPKTMLRLALSDPSRTLRVVADQSGSPTWCKSLAAQLLAILSRGGGGIYHAGTHGRASWYDFASFFLSEMKVPHSIEPCGTEDFPTRARRPLNSKLINRRLKDEGLDIMPDWRDDVRTFVKENREALIREIEKEVSG